MKKQINTLLTIVLIATLSATGHASLLEAIADLEAAEQNRKTLPHTMHSRFRSGDDPIQTEQVQYLPNQAPRLLQANGEPPNNKQIKQFERRTAREDSEPPFRFEINSETLRLEDSQGSLNTYRFEPIFIEGDQPTSYGQYFVGRLAFDTQQQHIAFLSYQLETPFRYKLFTVEKMIIETHYQRLNETLVPVELRSDVRMKNLVLDFDFSVSAEYLY